MRLFGEAAAARAVRATIIVACYFVFWLLFDRLSYAYAADATPWYLATALSFYLLYTFGLRYTPAVIAVNVLRGFLSAQHHLTFAWLFDLGLATAVVLVPTIWLMRRIGMRLFAGFNDALLYLTIGCVAFPFARALLGVAIICASGSDPWSRYWRDVYSFAVGDVVGMAALVPFLILFLTPLIARDEPNYQEPSTSPISRIEASALLTILAIGIISGYRLVGSQSNAVVYLFVFLPLTWLVIRGSLRWGVIGLLVADVIIVSLQRYFRLPDIASAAYQSYLAASSFTVITLGAAVNQRRREQREAVERARQDAVTGLPSRQAFEEWLADDVARTAAVTLLLIEFDAIRLADEWLDPKGADLLQTRIGDLLREHASASPLLAHVSSNVFALALPGDDAVAARDAAHAIVERFEPALNVGETELYVLPSIGIARAPAGSETLALFHHATQALQKAHDRGRGEIVVYETHDQEAVLSLVSQLHRAYRDDQFMMYYQPIWSCTYDLETGEARVDGLTGAEALLRWNHPERGTLAPSAFLDLLSSMPLSERVGKWVIENAVMTLGFMRESLPGCTMWINLFDRQTYAPDLVDTIRQQISRTMVPPESIVIELNEKTIAEDESDLQRICERLHEIGVKVAVDDFGTGHSSYARLREASVDILKIDRSFIPIGEPKGKTGDVLAGLLKFAQDIGVVALAEGVETDQQVAWLTRNGCTIIQGFALGAPMPSYAFIDMARRAQQYPLMGREAS